MNTITPSYSESSHFLLGRSSGVSKLSQSMPSMTSLYSLISLILHWSRGWHWLMTPLGTAFKPTGTWFTPHSQSLNPFRWCQESSSGRESPLSFYPKYSRQTQHSAWSSPTSANKKYREYRIKGIVLEVAQDFRIYDNYWIKNMIKVSCNYDDLSIFYRPWSIMIIRTLSSHNVYKLINNISHQYHKPSHIIFTSVDRLM